MGDNFGACVAGIGDFDGDGYDDILISAPTPRRERAGFISFPGRSTYVQSGMSVLSLSSITSAGLGVVIFEGAHEGDLARSFDRGGGRHRATRGMALPIFLSARPAIMAGQAKLT